MASEKCAGTPVAASIVAIFRGAANGKVQSSPTFYTIAGQRFTPIRWQTAISLPGAGRWKLQTWNTGSAGWDFPFTMNFSRVRNLERCFGARMKLFRMAGLAAGLIMVLVWAGCGDVYRPVAIPIAPAGGNPQAQRMALVVYAAVPACSTDAAGLVTCTCGGTTFVPAGTRFCASPGSTSQIDVSGDTDMADVAVGSLSPAAGSILPPGLQLDPQTGVISGTPTKPFISNLSVQVTDSSVPPKTATKALNITIPSSLTITTTSLAIGTPNVAYNATLQAAGGTQPYTWTYTGNLPIVDHTQNPPTVLTLAPNAVNPSAATINGTPTVPGTYNFTVQVTDSSKPAVTATQALSINISATPVVTTAALDDGAQNSNYNATLQAAGGVPPYTWSYTGSLPVVAPNTKPPTLLTFDPNAGTISGIPTVLGTSNFTVQVTDSKNNVATQALSITIDDGLVITTPVLDTGTSGVPYNATLQVLGGTGTNTYTWSIPTGTQNYAVLSAEGWVYVANNDDDNVFEFTSFTPGVTPAIIGLPPGSQPVAMVEASSASTVYVADMGANGITAISEVTNASATAMPLPVGKSPVAMAVNISGSKVYVANRDDNTVSVITTVDNVVNATTGSATGITVGTKPVSIVSNSLGSAIYVLNQGDGPGTPTIYVIDPFTDTVTGAVGNGPKQFPGFQSAVSPNFMIFDPHLARLYVSDPGAGQVIAFDASQSGPQVPVFMPPAIAIGGQPGAMAALPDGSQVYVADMGATSTCQVQVINTSSNTIAGSCLTLPLGAPTWLAISGDGSKLYVTETGGTSIISTSNNALVTTIAAPTNMTPVYVVSQ
jgi:DNA-binding beta-propeller fold protein YncE